MPHFFFNLRNDFIVDDEEGRELPDLNAAREVARKYALEMAGVSVTEHHHLDLRHRIEVVDEASSTVLVVRFGDVVSVEN